MGNAPTCIDCSEEVPKLLTFFDYIIPIFNGKDVYNFFTAKKWMKIGSDYICLDCLVKRQDKVRMEERQKRKKAEKEKREQEKREHEMKEKQRKEEEMQDQRSKEKEMIAQQKREQEMRQQQKREEGGISETNGKNTGHYDQRQKEEKECETIATSDKMFANWLKQRNTSDRNNVTIKSQWQTIIRPKVDPCLDWCISNRTQPASELQIDISSYDDDFPPILKKASKNIEINPVDVFHFLCGKQVGEHFDMSKDTLTETCQSILSLLRNKFRILPTNTTNVSQVVNTILQFSYTNACVFLLVLLCVHGEQLNLKTEMHTFYIIKQHCLRQKKYKDKDLSENILLRKFCDVLILLQTDALLSKVRTNIIDIFDRLYSTLLDLCFENDYIKSSLNLISTHKTWEFEDLLYLLWFVYCDCNQGEKVLRFICSFRSKPNEILSNNMTMKELLLTWNSEYFIPMLNSSGKEETQKTFSNVLDEMEYSKSINSQMKSDIHYVLEKVNKTIEKYGHLDKLHQYWKGFSHMQELLQANKITDISDEHLSICITEICRCVKMSQNYWPRCTQIISLCMLIKGYKNGSLLEINTGEGKTCIVAMFAVFLAVAGKSVDIISSSPLLAQRDSEEWSNFYRKFNVSVASNLTQKENSERLECYQKRVVYGTVGSFASDILRQEFLMDNVRGGRRCDVVIVDEVDCLFLDQGTHCTYLSHASPGMHHLEPILLMIWNEVIRHPVIRSDENQQYFLGKAEPFHVFLSFLINCPNDSEYNASLQIIYLLEMAEILPKKFTSCLIEFDVYSKETNTYKSTLTKSKLLECLQWIQSNFDISFDIYEILNESTIEKAQNAEPQTTGRTIKVLIIGEGLVCWLYEDKETLCVLIQSKIEDFISKKWYYKRIKQA